MRPSSDHLDSPLPQGAKNPTNISIVPDALAVYPNELVNQSAILDGIIGTARDKQSAENRFKDLPVRSLKLSTLKAIYQKKDEQKAVKLLSNRHSLQIDNEFRVKLGVGQVLMDTDESMIDYHLTIANQTGFSALLPNARTDHRFCFEMDLKKPYFCFKGKHAMLGFDPAGSMLYIGQCHHEDVFLAMAPKAFLQGHTQPCPPGRASASPLMSKRHYRQMVMMIAHFLALLPERPYDNVRSVYEMDLESSKPNFEHVTDTLYVFHSFPSIRSPLFRFPSHSHGVPANVQVGRTASSCARVFLSERFRLSKFLPPSLRLALFFHHLPLFLFHFSDQ